MVIYPGEHLRAAVSQQSCYHVGINALCDPKSGSGMSSSWGESSGMSGMLPMKPLHEGAEYAVCPVVGVVRLCQRPLISLQKIISVFAYHSPVSRRAEASAVSPLVVLRTAVR